jgi:hypothetical protein
LADLKRQVKSSTTALQLRQQLRLQLRRAGAGRLAQGPARQGHLKRPAS